MNIFEKIKPQARLDKNGFDLSQRTIFSCRAGQLIPFMQKPVVPGDFFQISANALVRTQTLNTAAFARMKTFYHFFFVPYQCLWHNWDTFISQRQNYESSYHQGSSFPPTFDLSLFLGSAVQGAVTGNGSSAYDNDDIFGYYSGWDQARLLDMLGYGKYLINNPDTPGEYAVVGMGNGLYPSLFPILAYNKIYYDYYANPYYEENDVSSYNVDDLVCNSAVSSRIPNARLMKIFQMRYRNWKKDYFTGLMPDQQFGSVVTIPLTPSLLTVKDDSNINHEIVATPQGPLYLNPDVGASTKLSIANNISVMDMRKAIALQKWRETTMRAGFRHADQQQAHFGVRPRNYEDNHAQYLGGFDDTVAISEVISTSASKNDNEASFLGQIGGKGVGAMNSDQVKANITEFGIIMGIMTVLPEADYNAFGMKKELSFTSPFDWYTPEFQNLGLAPVHQFELNSHFGSNVQNVVLGYGPRYLNYKTAVDEIHGEFCTNGTLSAWATPRKQGIVGEYSQGLPKQFFKCNPSCLDSIFAIQLADIDEKQVGKEMYDQFLINLYLDIKAIRPMSIIGLPY